MRHYKKIKLLLNYVLGPVLFLLIGFSIYQQIATQPDLKHHLQMVQLSFQQKGLWMLTVILLLMFLNWGIEAWKWQRLVRHLMPMTWFKALLGVLAGVSFTMLTPNRMGEFLGRLLYMPDGSRIKAATLTALSSMAQLMVTMAAGIVGVWYLLQYNTTQWPALLTHVMVFGTVAALLLTILVYFNLGGMVRLLEKWPAFSKYAPLIHAVGEIRGMELLKILAISALRYLVFLLQYGLVFHALDIQISWMDMVACTAAMFLILAIIPSISLAELGIRGKTSLYVFGIFSSNSVGILVASAVVWLINIILPAVAGSLIFLGIKLFGKASLKENE
ncbi:MAG TPA: lysylphosphatidylglycerol synthase domain-containing protein [Phnomibacter sp.]|nr:lysylphosphatidylglycerol synthase domain-containing protein [Phnomibacter sp.]